MGQLYGEDSFRAVSHPDYDDGHFLEAARMVFGKGEFSTEMMADPKVKAVVLETWRVLRQAVESAVPHETPPEVTFALEHNAFVFSGFKTYHALSEVGLSLTQEDGGIKPFGRFMEDVAAINDRYNRRYLEAEYAHATGSALMAARWQQAERDGDKYLLQYRTAGDEKVREEHSLLDGITLPPSDPFWSNYYPPNGWGCRCTAVQVPKGKYPESDPELAMRRGDNCTASDKARMFRFNPGKELNLFPPKHPYYKVPDNAKSAITKATATSPSMTQEQKIMAQLPDNLTTEEKKAIAKNCIAIGKALNKKVAAPMTVEQADRQSANPNYGKGDEFGINCQTCAPAYMLRLRGIDVIAKGNTKGSLSEYLSYGRSFEAWTNPDGSACKPLLTAQWMLGKGYKRMTAKRYKEYFEEACQEEGVYILTIGWKGGGGHATILQRFADKSLHYIEPQSYDKKRGTKRSVDELCNNGGESPRPRRGVLRVDNKIFNTKYLSIFE